MYLCMYLYICRQKPHWVSFWKAWFWFWSVWSMIRILLPLNIPYLMQQSWNEQSATSPGRGTFAAAFSIRIAQFHQLIQQSWRYSPYLRTEILRCYPFKKGVGRGRGPKKIWRDHCRWSALAIWPGPPIFMTSYVMWL